MLEVTVSFAWVAVHQFEDEVGCVGVEVWPSDVGGSLDDFLVEKDGIAVRLVVWRETGEHLEDEDAEGVPVYTFVVALLVDDLVRVLIQNQGVACRYITSGAR